MINHVRTLLLNRRGAGRPGSDFFLEEYVDPEFTDLILPSELLGVRAALFGAGPDDAWMNFRLRQFMTVLHSTEFVAYVLAYDRRISYDTDRRAADVADNVSSTPANLAAGSIRLNFFGRAKAEPAWPRLLSEWTLTALTPLVLKVETPAGASATHVVTVTDGVSSSIPLIGQPDLKVSVVADPIPAGAVWHIEALAEADADLTDLPGRLTAAGTLDGLFRPTAPYDIFRKLWEDHLHIQYRLSGVLLALAGRTEEVRLGG